MDSGGYISVFADAAHCLAVESLEGFSASANLSVKTIPFLYGKWYNKIKYEQILWVWTCSIASDHIR